jgi:arylsulfatase A-like enzyme
MYYRYYDHPSEHMVNKHYGVRTDRYKLIYFHDLNEWELFDLKNDPHELNSVYSDPKYAKVKKELTAELERLRKQLGDHDQWVDKPPVSVTGKTPETAPKGKRAQRKQASGQTE